MIKAVGDFIFGLFVLFFVIFAYRSFDFNRDIARPVQQKIENIQDALTPSFLK